MSFDGDLYPEAGASKVITSKGDLVRGDASGDRERYGIGSTGQVLAVASGTVAWETLSTADSVLTTQGDVLYEGASTLARLGQSTDNFTLATKGAGANPAWQASSTSVLTGAQDILYASAANTLTRLAAGSDGDVLTTHSTGSAPTWETPSSGGVTTVVQTSEITSNVDITSTSYVSTGIENTVSNNSGGVAICVSAISAIHSSTNLDGDWCYHDDGSATALETRMNNQANASNRKNPNPVWSQATDGSVISVYSKITSGTCTLIANMCNHVITEIY